jgi:hypothetical protein
MIHALLSLAVVLGAPSAVHSQPSPPAPVPAGSTEPADALFRKGNALYKQQKYAEAKDAFEQAFRLKKAHDIAANLAYTEMKLNLFRDAAEHLARAVRIWPPTGKDDKRQYAVERLALVKKEVATLSVQVSVPKAEVLVDGKSVGFAPIEEEVFVEPGERTIEARLAGYEEARQTIQAEKGAPQTVVLTLTASAPVPATTATSSVAPPPMASGAPTAPPPISVEPPRGPNRAVLIAGGATAGAALVAGVVFTVLASNKTDVAKEQHDELVKESGPKACAQTSGACQDLEGVLRDRMIFRNSAFWSFIGAGTLGVATGIYALATRRTPKVGVHATPVVTAQGAAVIVSGAW